MSSASPSPVPPLWLIASLTLSGTLAMHIFVPALPFAARDLDAGPGAIQLTLSLYIAGLALGQLVYGPISDHVGRRPVLAAGMVVYALAGLAAMLAPTVGALIAARLFQALGGCTGLVLGRAIVRDTAGGIEAARNLSLLTLMVMVGPGLSPLLGAALAVGAGWRSIFAVLCGLGLVNLVLVWRVLPETAGGAGHDLGGVLRNYARLARSRRFLAHAIGGGCATTSFFAFIGAAPFIFIDQLQRSPHEAGVYLALNIVGAWFGSLTVNRLVSRHAPRRLLLIGSSLSCLAAAAFVLCVLAGQLGVVATVLAMGVFAYGAGIASPAALALALGVDPRAAGSASGLYGFAQMAIGGVCTALVGVGGDPALAAGLVLVGASLVAQLAFRIAGPDAD